ncbi:hypothetical protein yaldo0001_14460 [Yersinia aldovae ATCC 35236]|uniref:Purine nucleoside phosphorylase n=1 Tax=Yersinia aldovae TaxID=29483 RepID=A0A0T9T512_YERAL|nr:DUF523 domain-containing protein [Yersinia aldovae]EEP95689.1 hypothetical protein yaldo0001_14460 [Yersinia aldovae ATCC 35236]CNK62500.1 purine nucleoside phosphorylase [Yersinia aldovae]CNK78371.1 purine nucleoside phosphorylase [Yersinia aldovae]
MESKPARILISACLMGKPVRYNATALSVSDEIIQRWQTEGRLVLVCPELSAGMPVPRPAAEIQQGHGEAVLQGQARVIEQWGNDVSREFLQGAYQTLELAQKHHCAVAILTEGSPSCGSSRIYDGNFSGSQRAGQGVTTALLRRHGIRVFSHHQLQQADDFLRNASHNPLNN